MVLNNFSTLRADLLNKLNIPAVEAPIPIKILWLDVICSGENEHTIYDGIHHHSFYEIHFVFQGEIAYRCDAATATAQAGYALLIPPAMPHKHLTQGANFQRASLAFAVDKNDLFEGFPTDFCCFPFHESITENIGQILRMTDDNTVFTPYLIAGRCVEILSTVLATLGIAVPHRESQDIDPRFTVAKAFVQNNHHRLITSDDVAKECCLSTKQLSRIFQRYTGKTMFEYIVNERVKCAQKLLVDSHKTIKEIGYALGFDNEGSFIAFFKRHCGITPSAFRKQQGTVENRFE